MTLVEAEKQCAEILRAEANVLTMPDMPSVVESGKVVFGSVRAMAVHGLIMLHAKLMAVVEQIDE
jgi:hypothetical protein